MPFEEEGNATECSRDAGFWSTPKAARADALMIICPSRCAVLSLLVQRIVERAERADHQWLRQLLKSMLIEGRLRTCQQYCV